MLGVKPSPRPSPTGRGSGGAHVSLPESIRDYQGQLLCFEPRHGWGWFRLGEDGNKLSLDYATVDKAGVFHIRAHRFFAFQGEWRGIVGRVEQPGHLFDGLWAT